MSSQEGKVATGYWSVREVAERLKPLVARLVEIKGGVACTCPRWITTSSTRDGPQPSRSASASTIRGYGSVDAGFCGT